MCSKLSIRGPTAGMLSRRLAGRTSEGYARSRGSALVDENDPMRRLVDEPKIAAFFSSQGHDMNIHCFSMEPSGS